ncbi:hypothetical protein ACJIZ3_009354 [Penstemon smallii]|uniref:Uncharacterized protein n=1 Tax=Penstemon smallii TaxID=265156 RepID=A0ABD3TEJ6_9LAMI
MPYFNNFHLIRETNLVGSQVWILKSILKLHKERERLNALKGDIVKEIPKFRDLLQDYINKCQLLFSESQSLDDESRSELIFFQDLEKVRKEMISLVKTMKRINKEYNAEDLKTSNKESPLADEDFGGNKALYIRGVYDEDIQQLIDLVTEKYSRLRVMGVAVMPGIE